MTPRDLDALAAMLEHESLEITDESAIQTLEALARVVRGCAEREREKP